MINLSAKIENESLNGEFFPVVATFSVEKALKDKIDFTKDAWSTELIKKLQDSLHKEGPVVGNTLCHIQFTDQWFKPTQELTTEDSRLIPLHQHVSKDNGNHAIFTFAQFEYSTVKDIVSILETKEIVPEKQTFLFSITSKKDSAIPKPGEDFFKYFIHYMNIVLEFSAYFEAAKSIGLIIKTDLDKPVFVPNLPKTVN